MRLVILGSGTSFGVPVIGCDCAVCQSDDPRDRRTRVAAVIEGSNANRVLIDTPPELRLQLVDAGIPSVDAVLYTHDHADHVHGIDDLRAISIRRTENLPVYGPPDSLDRIKERFSYIFDADAAPRTGTSVPKLSLEALKPGIAVSVAGIEVTPIEVSHGYGMIVYGYRFGEIAYLTDAKEIPREGIEALMGVRRLVVNGLFKRSHPTHLSISEACDLAATVGAEKTYLTNLTHETGHEELLDSLPDGVEPAFDGLIIEL